MNNYQQDENKYQYSSSWIHDLESNHHWRVYWQQQNIMHKHLKPGQEVLEIGVGTGFTANYLRSKGIQVDTIDIDAHKKPDMVANIVNYDFNQEYDHVLAFEVLEHIPYLEFQKVIQKIYQICSQKLFLSVPRNELVWLRVEFRLPMIGYKSFEITTLLRRVISKHHFWEIGDGKVSRKMFDEDIKKIGWDIVHSTKYYSKYFYTLEKKDSLESNQAP